MDNAEIFSRIDHTLLKQTATRDEVLALCEEAARYGAASVCIPPSHVKAAAREYGGSVTICTVIGFPLGYAVTEAKIAELRAADADGADEFDMVINLGDVKEGAFDRVTSEIAALKAAAGDKTLKVIVEACCLTAEEKAAVCACVTDGGADYIKTSTGFAASGATLEDVTLFRSLVGPRVKVKAAGGIRTKRDMEAFIEAGADRLGTSSGAKLFAEASA